MPTSIGLNTQLYKILPTPATALWSPLYAAYYLLLQGRVTHLRLTGKTLMGNLLPENRTDHKLADVDNPDPLNLAVRSQVNFSENVPYALLLIALAELNGVPTEKVHYILGTLFALRVLHVELGLYGKGTLGYGRPIGYYGTMAIIGGVAGWLGKLAWDSINLTL